MKKIVTILCIVFSGVVNLTSCMDREKLSAGVVYSESESISREENKEYLIEIGTPKEIVEGLEDRQIASLCKRLEGKKGTPVYGDGYQEYLDLETGVATQSDIPSSDLKWTVIYYNYVDSATTRTISAELYCAYTWLTLPTFRYDDLITVLWDPEIWDYQNGLSASILTANGIDKIVDGPNFTVMNTNGAMVYEPVLSTGGSTGWDMVARGYGELGGSFIVRGYPDMMTSKSFTIKLNYYHRASLDASLSFQLGPVGVSVTPKGKIDMGYTSLLYSSNVNTEPF